MLADTNQTGTLKVSRQARSIRIGVVVRWSIIGFLLATLLMGLIWTNNVTLYPGAEGQAAPVQLLFQPALSLDQQSSYQTSDDLSQVLSWYAQHLSLVHEMPQGDGCVTMTRVDAHMFFQQSLTVTICSQPTRTLIFVKRSLALR